MGFQDTKNIQGRLRSGYELVRVDEYPQEDFPAIQDGKYAGVIGHGGLVLTRVPEEIARQREEYYRQQAQDQVDATDNDLLKEQDRRMPIDIDKQSRTFGGKRQLEKFNDPNQRNITLTVKLRIVVLHKEKQYGKCVNSWVWIQTH